MTLVNILEMVEEAKDLLKIFKEHLSKARLERNYYNKNTKLAEEQRKLVDQNYTQGKTSYCSIMLLHITVMIELKMCMCLTQTNK